MVFHEKYELLALRGGQQEIALPGRELATGRDVLVHLLAAGYTSENQSLLRIISKIPSPERAHVLDTGDHEGIPYVVTDTLPHNLSLKDWAAGAAVTSGKTGPLATSGAWKFPPEPAPAKPEPPAPAAPPMPPPVTAAPASEP